VQTELDLGSDAPQVPTAADRAWLLDTLAQLVAAGGAGPLLAPPIVPGDAAFPDPWRPTLVGMRRVLRRLAWHAGLGDRAVEVSDARDEAVATTKLIATEAELATVTATELRFAVYSIGTDDIAGTLAHEVGIAVAVSIGALGGDPYRAPDPATVVERADHDLRVGSVAAVWSGLGALAANASYQQYSGGQYKAHLGFAPLEYEVIRAGHLPLGALAFLLAVQCEIGGHAAKNLGGPQRDEVAAWQRALAGRRDELRARLGIPDGAAPVDRPTPVPFADEPDPEHDLARDAGGERAATKVFRVEYNRAGPGAMVGVVFGVIAGTAFQSPVGLGLGLGTGVILGFGLGRLSRRDRCSHCIAVLPQAATACPGCRGTIAGRIQHRNQRLDHEDEDD
jgi:hypothetical protein